MTVIKRLIREPLVQFLFIGIAIFGMFFEVTPPEPAEAQDSIVVTDQKVAQMVKNFVAVWKRPPTTEQLDGLIESYIREEILVRQALAWSLDQDDTVIRQRLRQKMEFLMESGASGLSPEEGELSDFYERNATRYARGSQIALQQVYLGETPTSEEIEEALTALQRDEDAAEVGRRSLLPSEFPLSSQAAIDATFGRSFFERLENLTPGTWTGPIQSAYGTHLVRVREIRAGTLPSLETIRENVLRDWTREKTTVLAEAEYNRLRGLYRIERPDPDQFEAILR